MNHPYDNWNVIAELDENNQLLRSYLWGADMSGTMQGAGGVGGLLAVKPANDTAHFAATDGNGNVVELVDAGTGNTSATYEYGPFGEPIRATGPMARANSMRWSTKCTDDETDLVYYGYRFYNPSTGRWLSRDPASEKAGLNLHGFVENDPLSFFDALGLVKQGDVLDVKHLGAKVGQLEIKVYRKNHVNEELTRGAAMEIVPRISDCSCGTFKWRQRLTETRDGSALAAPKAGRPGKWRYYNGPKTFSNVLDLDYSKPLTGEQWYPMLDGGIPGECAYTFIDYPSVPMPIWEVASEAKSVKVKFSLELVLVQNASQKFGGAVLLTIPWGYTFTKSSHDIIDEPAIYPEAN